MGISLTWVAVEALPADEALLRLSLVKTSKNCLYPFKGVASHSLPDDWFLVAAQRCDHRIANTASMSAFSKGCRAVACAIEEHVNFASAELWQDGARVWHVQHQGDEDNENISSQGQLPQRFRDYWPQSNPRTVKISMATFIWIFRSFLRRSSVDSATMKATRTFTTLHLRNLLNSRPRAGGGILGNDA